jgi:hypothetical protein
MKIFTRFFFCEFVTGESVVKGGSRVMSLRCTTSNGTCSYSDTSLLYDSVNSYWEFLYPCLDYVLQPR